MIIRPLLKFAMVALTVSSWVAACSAHTGVDKQSADVHAALWDAGVSTELCRVSLRGAAVGCLLFV